MSGLLDRLTKWLWPGVPMAPAPEPEPEPEPEPAPKRRFRIRQDGWVWHDGGPCPLPPKTRCETLMRGGLLTQGNYAEYADYWPAEWWEQKAISWRHNIIAFRPIEAVRDWKDIIARPAA